MRLPVLSIAVASLSAALTVIVASPAAKKSHASASTSKKTGTKSRGKIAAKAVPRRVTQQQPTINRYRQIQQALVDRGYFNGTADGNWGASSQEALKRFQHDQNLEEDGKLDSLSLIALGLGPTRTASNIVRERPDSPATESKP